MDRSRANATLTRPDQDYCRGGSFGSTLRPLTIWENHMTRIIRIDLASGPDRTGIAIVDAAGDVIISHVLSDQPDVDGPLFGALMAMRDASIEIKGGVVLIRCPAEGQAASVALQLAQAQAGDRILGELVGPSS